MSTLSKSRRALLVAGALIGLVTVAGCDPAETPVAQPTPASDLGPAPAPVTTDLPQPPADAGPDPAPNPAPPPPAPKPPAGNGWPQPEDCVRYNAANLTVQYDNGTYTVSDGGTVVTRVYGQEGDNVGDKALALAQRYRKHCYLGRDNTRPEDRGHYIFDYWRGSSGLTPEIADQYDDCSSYNRHNLTVEDMGGGYGWRVKDHDHVLHLFDNESDARNGKLVLARYGHACSIGDNDDGKDSVSYHY
jgi:hypothetical protein